MVTSANAPMLLLPVPAAALKSGGRLHGDDVPRLSEAMPAMPPSSRLSPPAWMSPAHGGGHAAQDQRVGAFWSGAGAGGGGVLVINDVGAVNVEVRAGQGQIALGVGAGDHVAGRDVVVKGDGADRRRRKVAWSPIAKVVEVPVQSGDRVVPVTGRAALVGPAALSTMAEATMLLPLSRISRPFHRTRPPVVMGAPC